MASSVICLPGSLHFGPCLDWLGRSPTLARWLDCGYVKRLVDAGASQVDESAWLGHVPAQQRIPNGPLIVASLGLDPPARSIQYQLDLLRLIDGAIHPLPLVPRSHLEAVWTELKRLETSRLKILGTASSVGGLVIEDGSPEMRIETPENLEGKPLLTNWPVAEDETRLRQLIDDSINLLGDLEVNRQRADQGESTIDLMWPWDGGFRPLFENLALKFGRTGFVAGRSARLAGITSLSGWKFEAATDLGQGTRVRLETAFEFVQRRETSILVFDSFSEFGRKNMLEEANWLVSEFESRFFEPLDSEILKLGRTVLLLLTPLEVGGSGLAVRIAKDRDFAVTKKFDLNDLEDSGLPTSRTWESVDSHLRWNPNS